MFEINGELYTYESEITITSNLRDYIKKDVVKVFHKEPASSKKGSFTMVGVKSAINTMVHRSTEGYKYEMYHREGLMLEKLGYITVTDHKNGYITAELHSNQLDYTVQVAVESPHGGSYRGTVTG